MSAQISVVIVDDEALARDAIRLRLEQQPDIRIAGEASNGFEAVKLIEALRPDVVFLDVKMPELDGFEVIDRVSSVHLPIVVFVTAHDRFAIRAFETAALDYLLKPFTAERFTSALNRARLAVANAGDQETHQRLIALLDRERPTASLSSQPAAGPPAYLARLVVRRNQRLALVRVDDVEWIESSANYARLHVRGEEHLVRMTMAELEQRLDPGRFARVHRSAIVRIDRVKDIIPEQHGDFTLILVDGTTLRMSRNYRSRLQQ